MASWAKPTTPSNLQLFKLLPEQMKWLLRLGFRGFGRGSFRVCWALSCSGSWLFGIQVGLWALAWHQRFGGLRFTCFGVLGADGLKFERQGFEFRGRLPRAVCYRWCCPACAPHTGPVPAFKNCSPPTCPMTCLVRTLLQHAGAPGASIMPTPRL